jgi:hypothetical protein
MLDRDHAEHGIQAKRIGRSTAFTPASEPAGAQFIFERNEVGPISFMLLCNIPREDR